MSEQEDRAAFEKWYAAEDPIPAADKDLPSFIWGNIRRHQQLAWLAACRHKDAEAAGLREALEAIRDKAGSNTVNESPYADPRDDHGYIGIHAVACEALGQYPPAIHGNIEHGYVTHCSVCEAARSVLSRGDGRGEEGKA